MGYWGFSLEIGHNSRKSLIFELQSNEIQNPQKK